MNSRALEEAVLDSSGCAVVISHDRWFLDRVATRILAYEVDSEVVWLEGIYKAYSENLKKRKGPDADQPHRIKRQKLMRKYGSCVAVSDHLRRLCHGGLRDSVAVARIESVETLRYRGAAGRCKGGVSICAGDDEGI
jgi:hypothetical protein